MSSFIENTELYVSYINKPYVKRNSRQYFNFKGPKGVSVIEFLCGYEAKNNSSTSKFISSDSINLVYTKSSTLLYKNNKNL